jgi:hypothetical protein
MQEEANTVRTGIPAGSFRIVLIDGFSGEPTTYGHASTLEDAIRAADSLADEWQKAIVYDDAGKFVHESKLK